MKITVSRTVIEKIARQVEGETVVLASRTTVERMEFRSTDAEASSSVIDIGQMIAPHDLIGHTLFPIHEDYFAPDDGME